MVEPMGFRLTEKNLKRAGCDYWDDVEVVRWPCVEAFFAAHGDDELHLFAGQAACGYRDAVYGPVSYTHLDVYKRQAGLFGIDPVFALSVSTAALLGAAMRQPLMVALLLILCFPAKAVVFVLAAACLGAAVPVPKAFSRV